MCGMLLADFGAEVIKVEPPVGDQVRYLFGRRHTDSPYFAAINRNKRSICLDLTSTREPARRRGAGPGGRRRHGVAEAARRAPLRAEGGAAAGVATGPRLPGQPAARARRTAGPRGRLRRAGPGDVGPVVRHRPHRARRAHQRAAGLLGRRHRHARRPRRGGCAAPPRPDRRGPAGRDLAAGDGAAVRPDDRRALPRPDRRRGRALPRRAATSCAPPVARSRTSGGCTGIAWPAARACSASTSATTAPPTAWCRSGCLSNSLYDKFHAVTGLPDPRTEPGLQDGHPGLRGRSSTQAEALFRCRADRRVARALPRRAACRAPATTCRPRCSTTRRWWPTATPWSSTTRRSGVHQVPAPAVRFDKTPSSARFAAPTLDQHTDEVLAELGFGVPEVSGWRAAGVIGRAR